MSFQGNLIEHLTLIGEKFNSCHAPNSGQFCSTGGSGLGIAGESEVSKGIMEVQAYGLETGNEGFVSYDAEGNRINGMVKGNETSVSNAYLVTTSDSYVTVHNHPGSNSFSPDDVDFFANTDPKHMIAVGHDGTLYKLSKPDNWKPKPGKDYKKAWLKVKDSPMAAKYQHRVLRGENSKEVWKEQTHEIMTKVSSDMGLEYTRILPGA